MRVIYSDEPSDLTVIRNGDKNTIIVRESIRHETSIDGEPQYSAEEYRADVDATPNLLQKVLTNKEAWKQYVITLVTEREKQKIRSQRESECFSVINRGQMWFDTLSEKQKSDLNDWYRAWLDAPETLTIPDKPEWL